MKAATVLCRMVGPPEIDGQLLARFATARDEAAFVELVRRHGSLVLAACRRVLGDGPGADDAFQAAFLVLARKAATIRDTQALGNWLYGVARHAALRLRDSERRRRRHEAMVAARTVPEPIESVMLDAVDEELGRLPERYRLPLVACFLEGRTQENAAQVLGLSLSTLRRHLECGRNLLRGRLERRGVAPAAALAAVCGASVSPTLASETARLAGAFLLNQANAPGAALAQEILNMITRTRFRAAATTILAIAGIVGLSVAWQLEAAQPPISPPEAKGKKTPPANLPGTKDEKPVPTEKGKAGDRIKPGDLLYITAANVFEVAPVNGVYVVEPGGKTSLGPHYGGRVKLEGLTLEEAEVAVRDQIKIYVKDPLVSVVRLDPEVGDLGLRVRHLERQVDELRAEVKELTQTLQKIKKKE